MFVHLQEHKQRIKIIINQTETKLDINRWIFSARPSDWTNLPIWALYQVLVYPCQVGHFYYELLIPSSLPHLGSGRLQSSQVRSARSLTNDISGRFSIPGQGAPRCAYSSPGFILFTCQGIWSGSFPRGHPVLPSHYGISKPIPTEIL